MARPERISARGAAGRGVGEVYERAIGDRLLEADRAIQVRGGEVVVDEQSVLSVHEGDERRHRGRAVGADGPARVLDACEIVTEAANEVVEAIQERVDGDHVRAVAAVVRGGDVLDDAERGHHLLLEIAAQEIRREQDSRAHERGVEACGVLGRQRSVGGAAREPREPEERRVAEIFQPVAVLEREAARVGGERLAERRMA